MREAAIAAAGARRRRRRAARRSPCAVVAVSSGDGLAELFGQLGVQGVVTGGQTLNPSTAELLDAVERGQRRPGRGPARTTRTSSPSPSRSTRSPPRRCASCRPRSMPEGARRAVVYDPEATRRRQRRRDAPRPPTAVATGEVTQAVRDSQQRRPARSPRATGSGIVRGDGIVAVAPDVARRRRTALLDAPRRRRAASSSRSSPAPTPTPATRPRSRRGWPTTGPDVEVEVHDGGQPLYPYLVRRRVRPAAVTTAADHAARARRHRRRRG